VRKERRQVVDRKGGLIVRPRGKSRVTSGSGKGSARIGNRPMTYSRYILTCLLLLIEIKRREKLEKQFVRYILSLYSLLD